MEAFLATILTYISVWAPSLVAILGVVATVVVAINRVISAIKGMKEDVDFAEVKKKLETLAAENQELARLNKLLLDKITKIKDYADVKKKEE